MPDWSYHTLFKPVLHKLPVKVGREFIHRGMSTIASFLGGRAFIEFLGHMKNSHHLEQHLFGISFRSPVGLSGRIDPQLSGLKAFQHLGFGFIEVGPLSLRGVEHEPTPILHKKSERIDFDPSFSLSVRKAKAQLDTLKKKEVPLLLKLEGTGPERIKLIEELRPYADAFILNGDCEKGIDRKEIKRHTRNIPVLLSYQASSSVFEAIQDLRNIDGIVIEESGTIKNFKGFIQAVKAKVGPTIPIIASGGIQHPKDALALLQSGASLVFVSSGYVFSGPGLPKRINELILDSKKIEPPHIQGWIWYWLFGLMIFLGGLLALLFSMSVVILPYDESFLGLVRREIIEFNSNILYFMAHDRMTLAGTMISGGFLYMQLAKYGVKKGLHWARKAINIAAITGFLGILLFIGYGYFDWLHGVFWLILLPFFILGFFKTKHATQSPSGKNLFNTTIWKRSLYGQLAFVILGFSLLLGGLIISFIGVTTVFVPTDISYLCITPEALNEYNQRLIPVIAHDRAGFGSALVSVGALVLMISLWGIRQGEKWIWWTLTLGAIPAFLSGLITHYVIGYTDFGHLQPAYFALLLYVIGCFYTAPFLVGTNQGKKL
ncbi:dihydroorotate dehydrogenase [Bacillus salitolerans]|uniref:Dihydroorotate dehydrogenase n=1 Tax=Bacillus salitolerans TaxID=1437434 RepID=A0ABW4LV73_9BACI